MSVPRATGHGVARATGQAAGGTRRISARAVADHCRRRDGDQRKREDGAEHVVHLQSEALLYAAIFINATIQWHECPRAGPVLTLE